MKKNAKAIKQLLYYCAINWDSSMWYKESYMVIHVHSDVSYL